MNHERRDFHNLRQEAFATGLLTSYGIVGTVFSNLALEVSAGKQILDGPEIVLLGTAVGLGSRVLIGLIDRLDSNNSQNNPR